MKAYTVSLTKNYLDDSEENKTYIFRIEFDKLICFEEQFLTPNSFVDYLKKSFEKFDENVEIIINTFKDKLTDLSTTVSKGHDNNEIILAFRATLSNVDDFSNFLSELEILKKELLLNKSIFMKIKSYV